MVNIFQPGAGVTLTLSPTPGQLATMAHAAQGPWDILLHLVPTSVVDSMARGDILQIVVFRLFFGIALAAIGAPGRRRSSTCSTASRR